MAIKVHNHIGHTGIELDLVSDYYRTSATSTAVYKGACRVAGYIVHGLTASAGNTVKFKLVDGTASTGTVFHILSAGAVTLGSPTELPYIRFRNGLYLDYSAEASTSASGVQGLTVLYVEDGD